MKYPGFREALFTPPDARGNAPHATREQADSEGRRLNAMRYETVQQAEQALDRRAARPLGAVPPPTTLTQPSGLFLLGAIAAAVAGWAFLRSRADEPDDDEDDEGVEEREPAQVPTAPASPPAAPFTLNVMVSPTPGEPPKVTTALLPNPAPVPEKKRRRRKTADAPPAEPVSAPETKPEV